MKDSNQFHAVCLDTYPPCVYMTDVSHRIAAIVHGYNKNAGETCVSITVTIGWFIQRRFAYLLNWKPIFRWHIHSMPDQMFAFICWKKKSDDLWPCWLPSFHAMRTTKGNSFVAFQSIIWIKYRKRWVAHFESTETVEIDLIVCRL